LKRVFKRGIKIPQLFNIDFHENLKKHPDTAEYSILKILLLKNKMKNVSMMRLKIKTSKIMTAKNIQFR
jgi:hypothetical protein